MNATRNLITDLRERGIWRTALIDGISTGAFSLANGSFISKLLALAIEIEISKKAICKSKAVRIMLLSNQKCDLVTKLEYQNLHHDDVEFFHTQNNWE